MSHLSNHIAWKQRLGKEFNCEVAYKQTYEDPSQERYFRYPDLVGYLNNQEQQEIPGAHAHSFGVPSASLGMHSSMGTTHFSYAKQNPLLYKPTSSSSSRKQPMGSRNRPQLYSQPEAMNSATFSRSSKSRFSVFNLQGLKNNNIQQGTSESTSVNAARDIYGKRIRKRFNEFADKESVKSMNSEVASRHSLTSGNLLAKSAVNMTPSANSNKGASMLSGSKASALSGPKSSRYSYISNKTSERYSQFSKKLIRKNINQQSEAALSVVKSVNLNSETKYKQIEQKKQIVQNDDTVTQQTSQSRRLNLLKDRTSNRHKQNIYTAIEKLSEEELMKVSEMLRSEKTDKEVCDEADKLVVEEYFENDENIVDQEAPENAETIDVQDKEEVDDWEVIQEENKDDLVSLNSKAIYSTYDLRSSRNAQSTHGVRSQTSSQAICLLDAQLAQEKKRRKDLETELNELKVVSMQYLDQDNKSGTWTAKKRVA